MQMKVLRPFPLSRDGVRVERVESGATVDIPDALVPGLRAGRWIDDPEAVQPPPAAPPGSGGAGAAGPPASVAIPEAWRDLSAGDLRALAQPLSDKALKNRAEAEAAVEAELARRAAPAS